MLAARGRAGKIRAPRKSLGRDDVDVDGAWKILESAFADIHAKKVSTLSYETLSRCAYNLVLKKKQDVLYDRVCAFEEAYLASAVRSQVSSGVSSILLAALDGQAAEWQANERLVAGEAFLRAVNSAFKDEQLSMSLITSVLLHLERAMMRDSHRPSIYVAVMDTFRRVVLQAPIQDRTAASTGFTALDLLETTMLDMIQRERKGEQIDRALVRACCHVLEGLYEGVAEDENTKLYVSSFEPRFLEASQRFYYQEGLDLVAEADASTFCLQARRRLREEDERCQQTIAPCTEAKIRAVVEHELVGTHIKDVINMEATGVKSMLDNNRLTDLANIYELVSSSDSLKEHLKVALHKRVTELGAEINQAANITFASPPSLDKKGKDTKSSTDATETKDAAKHAKDTKTTKETKDAKAPPERPLSQQTQAAILWVEQILKLKAKYDHIWEAALAKDQLMHNALEVAFQDFINVNERSSEYVSLFIDEYLKRGTKAAANELELDAILDQAILLLQYLANTDLFETYYRKHLARRLLMKKIVSRDVERQLLSKIKIKIGNHVTTKLEGMIKDTDTSDNLAAQYKEYVRNLGDADPKRVELDARILTTNQWPFELLSRNDSHPGGHRTCNFPPVIESVKMRFQKFYDQKHTGRKLTWMPNLGDADVRATFRSSDGKPRRYELNMSTYCMVVVLLFNDLEPGQGLTFEQIEAETNIARPDLIKTLTSLSLVPKWRVLKREPQQAREVQPTDTFYFNENFSSPFVKIKITSINTISGGGGGNGGSSNRLENAEERRATRKRVDEERGHLIEAAIVRIMKQRKTLTHQQLMTETLQQLSSRFQPDVSMVKKKIEALIDREYLERGPDTEQATYNYLA